MEVRDMIAKLMKDKEVTYAELEKRTGLPRSVLNRYVNGVTKKIPIDNLEKIAKALGVPPVYFVVGDIEIRPEDGRTYIDPAAAIAREAIGSVPEEPSVNQAQEKAFSRAENSFTKGFFDAFIVFVLLSKNHI